MVDSVDDLKSSQSIRGHRIPNFEMLDAKVGSSLKKIIQRIKLQERVHLAEYNKMTDPFAEDRSLSRSTNIIE